MHCLTSHVWKYFSFCLGVEVVNELLALLLHCADQLSVHDVWKLVEVHAAREDPARSSPGVCGCFSKKINNQLSHHVMR